MSPEEEAYNLTEYALKMPDLERLGDSFPVRLGAMAPDFEAALVAGGEVRLAAHRGKSHVVLLMGSITSPTCVLNVPAMNEIYRELNPAGVDMYLVYTREAHPAERYPRHTSFEQKRAHAREFQRLENVAFPILVDSLDGKIHNRYGFWPTAAFVVHKDGRLVYRSNIAYPKDLRPFLEDLVASDRLANEPVRVPHMVYLERLIERQADREIHRRVYERAGPKALEDYWKFRPELRNRWP